MGKLLSLASLAAGALAGWALVASVEAFTLEKNEAPQPRRNSDGLHEIPRAYVLRHAARVLVVGGAFVEGAHAPREEALPALLTESISGTYFVNAGFEKNTTATRVRELVAAYKPRGILWFFTEAEESCAGLEGFRRQAGALPVLPVYLGTTRASPPPCLEKFGPAPVVVSFAALSRDERETYVEREGEPRLHPAGLIFLTAQIVPQVEEWLKKKNPASR